MLSMTRIICRKTTQLGLTFNRLSPVNQQQQRCYNQGSRSVAIMDTLGEAITKIMRSRAAIILAIMSFCWQLWSQIMRISWKLWETIYSFRVQLQELPDSYRVQLSEKLPNYEKHFKITGYDKGTVFYSSTPWLRLSK